MYKNIFSLKKKVENIIETVNNQCVSSYLHTNIHYFIFIINKSKLHCYKFIFFNFKFNSIDNQTLLE